MITPWLFLFFKDLGLDVQKAKKLASKLHVYAVNYTYKLVPIRLSLENPTAISSSTNPANPCWLFPFSFLGGLSSLVAPFPLLMQDIFTLCACFLLAPTVTAQAAHMHGECCCRMLTSLALHIL